MDLQRLSCGLIEIKLAGAQTDDKTFEGYGAFFGNVDSYGDVIQGGAFVDTLAQTRKTGQWPSLLSQHGGFFGSAEDMNPVGLILDLAEDGKGLWMQGKLADTARGVDLYKLLKMTPRPAISGLSIGYYAKEWTAGTKPTEPRRTLTKIDLVEISLVTNPANPKARVQNVKSIEELQTLSDAESYLRDVGFSQRQAVAFVSRIKTLRPSDSEEYTRMIVGLPNKFPTKL